MPVSFSGNKLEGAGDQKEYDSGLCGVVYERTDDGSFERTVTSAENGRFVITMPPGRYDMRVEHPDYENIQSGGGADIVEQGEMRTRNLFLERS